MVCCCEIMWLQINQGKNSCCVVVQHSCGAVKNWTQDKTENLFWGFLTPDDVFQILVWVGNFPHGLQLLVYFSIWITGREKSRTQQPRRKFPQTLKWSLLLITEITTTGWISRRVSSRAMSTWVLPWCTQICFHLYFPSWVCGIKDFWNFASPTRIALEDKPFPRTEFPDLEIHLLCGVAQALITILGSSQRKHRQHNGHNFQEMEYIEAKWNLFLPHQFWRFSAQKLCVYSQRLFPEWA